MIDTTILEFANKLAASKVKKIDLDSPAEIARLLMAGLEVAVAPESERAATEQRLVAELEREFTQ